AMRCMSRVSPARAAPVWSVAWLRGVSSEALCRDRPETPARFGSHCFTLAIFHAPAWAAGAVVGKCTRRVRMDFVLKYSLEKERRRQKMMVPAMQGLCRALVHSVGFFHKKPANPTVLADFHRC